MAAQEAKRHERIAEVIESTQVRIFFTLENDSDFSGTPRAVTTAEKGAPWTVG